MSAKPENERERIALEPCPFCGSEAIRCQNHEGRLPEAMIWIMCKACHASPGDFPTDERAIAAWNRRAPLPQQGEAVTSGWVMVPREPTEAMTRAWWRSHFSDDPVPGGRTDRDAYAAMLAAAPRAAVAEPVAWRVKDFADGWILCHSRAQAEREAESAGNLIQALGVIGPPASQALAEPVGWKLVPTYPDVNMLAAYCRQMNLGSQVPGEHNEAERYQVAAYIAMIAAAPRPPVPAVAQARVDEEPRDDTREDAWTGFEGDHLTDGKGYAAADVYRRCRTAFDAAWPQGRKAAIDAATRALATSINTPKPAGLVITEEAVERFRAWYLKHTGKRIFDKNARAALTAALSGDA